MAPDPPEYTRDPRIAQRVIEHWGDGNEAKPNGLGSAQTILTTYRLTGDKRLLALLSFAPPRRSPMVPRMLPPSLSRTMMGYPYAMSGLAEVGATGDVLIDRDAHKQFWKPYMEQWQATGKKLWGSEIKP